jgi:hypothetical protein
MSFDAFALILVPSSNARRARGSPKKRATAATASPAITSPRRTARRRRKPVSSSRSMAFEEVVTPGHGYTRRATT